MLYPYAYLLGDLAFLAVWGLLFWKARAFRREMIVLSLITGFFGPISEYWYFADYWQPELLFKFPIGGFEDFLFGFSIGGIGAVVYEVIFVNHICLCQRKKLKKEWYLLIFGLILGTTMVVLNNLLGVNSIYASSLGMIFAAAIMLYFRPDLILNAVGSGILVALIMFFIYIIPQILFPWVHQWMAQMWKLYGSRQGILLFAHVPLTEMIWGFSWGFVWGPIYEFMVGARVLRIRR